MAWTSHHKLRSSDWGIWINEQGRYDHDAVTRSILLDIREELRDLNHLLRCENFTTIPKNLRAIATNTRRKPISRNGKRR